MLGLIGPACLTKCFVYVCKPAVNSVDKEGKTVCI
jgi:hypothetical protein